jgi:hypothetical protein
VSTTTNAAQAARAELGAKFAGELVGPEDPSYEPARAVYNAMIDRRPALIARCTSTADVAETISFARRHDLLLAVRGGGHNGGGLGVCDDGVVVDLSLMQTVEVDPGARTVRVGGGCTWAQVDAATHEAGLATPSGIVGTTGVGGLTLGAASATSHASTGSRSTICSRPTSSLPTARRRARAPQRTPSSSGRFVAGAETSASSPHSTSGRTRSPPCWPDRRCGRWSRQPR